MPDPAANAPSEGLTKRQRRMAVKAMALDSLINNMILWDAADEDDTHGLTADEVADVWGELSDQLTRWALRITPMEALRGE